MSGVLFWSECMEEVYGKVIDFENENEFIKIVRSEYKDYNNKECEVLSIEVETCICTEMGIEGDSIIPLKLTDTVIENFYIADVISTNESERKCRVCGCTWNNACEGGCYWVEENLCSKCAELVLKELRVANLLGFQIKMVNVNGKQGEQTDLIRGSKKGDLDV